MNHDDDKTVMRSSHRPLPRTSNTGGTGMTGMGRTEMQGVNALPAGTHLGEFEILGLIGEGGFGIVYLAYDHSLDRQVALKEYMPSGLAQRTSSLSVAVRSAHYADTFNMGLKSFVGEARMLARFDSPSLVKVYRFWEENGTAYMVMPYYEGITLKQAIKDRLIEPDETWIRALLANLLDAVDTIHQVQCYHRDIAPDNILLLKDGRPLLLDFGAARRVIGDLTQGLTVILKPGFAPIEQYADIPGLRQGPWTDMYALGAVVYFLITGKPPIAAVGRPLNDDMIPAGVAGHGRYSEQFLATVDRMLAVRPEHRVQSVAELRELLRLEEGTRTMPQASAAAQALAGTRTAGGPAAHGRTPEGNDDEWLKTLTADKRAMPPKKARSKLGAAIAAAFLAIGVGAGVVGYLKFWPGAEGEQMTADAAADAAAGNAGPAGDASAAADPRQSGPEIAAAPPPAVEAPPPPASSAALAPAPPETQPTVDPAPAVPPVAIAPPAPTASPAPAAAPAVPPAAAPPAGAATRPATQPEEGRGSLSAAAPARQAPVAPAQTKDDEKWLEATAKDSRAAYEAYLKQYPRGKHAGAARVMLDAVRGRKAETPALAAQPPAPETGTQSAANQLTAPAAEKAAEKPAPRPEEKLAASPAGPPGAEPPAKAHAAQAAASPQSSSGASGTGQSAAGGGNDTPPIALAAPSAQAKPEPRAEPEPKAAEPEKPQAEPSGAASPGAAQQTFKFPGQTMVGNFSLDSRSGMISGTGRITWDNGDRYEGRLVKGIKEGRGTFVWANGQQYSGEWSGDKPNGKGVLQFANGNRYEGEVKDGQPNGRGTTRFKNGDVQTGNWTNGVINGQARLTWASGDRYEGEVRNGEPNGRGTTRFRSGDAYSGEWVKGRHHGQGRYTWASGSYWEGEFRDGQQTANGQHGRPENSTQTATANPPSNQDSGAESSGK